MMVGTWMNGGNPRNRRTGMILALIALGFFLAILLKYWWFK